MHRSQALTAPRTPLIPAPGSALRAARVQAPAGIQNLLRWVPAFAGTSGRVVVTALIVVILDLPAAQAQDVRGLEVCTAEKQMDRRTGCLQANIDYLMSVIDKNARETRQKLDQASKDLTASRNEITTLKAQLAATQARLEKLEKPEKSKDAK